MAAVIYNGNKIEPSPLLVIDKGYQVTDDGTKIGSLFNITLHGTILAEKGSPDSTGAFYTGSLYTPDARAEPTYYETLDEDEFFAVMLRKKEAIRDLFSEDGKQLEWQAWSGDQPMKCNPRVISLSFGTPDEKWFHKLAYTVVLECDVMSVNGVLVGEDEFDDYISQANENWSIETLEQAENEFIPRTYRMTHTVSAKGKRHYDDTGSLVSEGWQQARNYVNKKLGIYSGAPGPSATLDLPVAYNTLNHVRTENIGQLDGSYSVTESWLLASGLASEDFTITTTTNRENGLTNVSVNGTIQGFEERNTSLSLISTKITNATNKFNDVSGVVLTRAQSYSGTTLNVIPQSTTVAKNPTAGVINYTYEYNNRPANFITGTKSEVIAISDSFGVDVFAVIPVLGRQAGPVLQDINTQREKTRSVTMELVMENPGPSSDAVTLYNNSPFISPIPSADVQALVTAIKPAATTAIFVANQSTNWDMTGQRGNLDITWVYE